MVDVEPVCELPNIISLGSIRENERCEGMLLIRKGQRLSVQPVEEIHFDVILDMVGMSRDDL
jgi:predicted RNA-binding protein with PUA-like domain